MVWYIFMEVVWFGLFDGWKNEVPHQVGTGPSPESDKQ